MKKISIFISLLILLFFFTIPTNANQEEYIHYHIVDIDHPISFKDICARYNSYDTVDGFITDSLTFHSEYESAEKEKSLKVFDYVLDISVKNSRGKIKERQDIISVRDFKAPEIQLIEKEIVIDISKEDVEQKLLNSIKITDNYDTSFPIYHWEGLSEALKNGSGSYIIHLTVEDNSHNLSSTETISLTLMESIQKIIHSTPITITSAQSEKEIIQSFLQTNSISFNYDSVEISSNYFQNLSKNGIYTAEIQFLQNEETICIYQVKLINKTKIESKKDSTFTYITLSILGLCILAGIIIYYKRR